MARVILLATLAALGVTVSAHETRPAFLEIVEGEGGRHSFAFRQPQLAGRFLGLGVTSECEALGEPQQILGRSAVEHRWEADCGDLPLVRAGLRVRGLERSLVDVLVLVRGKDGTEAHYVLTPSAPVLSERGGGLAFVPAYFLLGVDHLVFGLDHVAFLLALMYLLRSLRVLVIAVTSFTLAHSVTLGMAALGLAQLPAAPVEALIALSIILVAHEIAAGREDSLLQRRPWALTFVFGLLHGFGFAGALAETGLPEGSALLALALFNLGIEAGQLAIIGLVVAALWLSGRLRALAAGGARLQPLPQFAVLAPVYGIGALGGYWFVDRSLGIVLGG